MRKLDILRVILVFTTIVQLGCATLFQRGPDHIPIKTNPDGAMIYLNGSRIGISPIVLSVEREDDCAIEIRKEGFESVTLIRHKVVTGWFFGNLLFGAGWPIGMVVDLATHNQGKYSQNNLNVDLIPLHKVAN